MRIAVCEDEIIYQEKINLLLNNYYDSIDVLVKIFDSGEGLLEYLEESDNEFDIYFMDIEMEKINGIRTSEILRSRGIDKPIILVTSHMEMAVDGYDIDAFNFIPKPINADRLYKVLDKIKDIYAKKNKLCVISGDSTIILDVDDIKYIKADNVYIDIYTKKDKITVRKKISDMENELPGDSFYRPHKSYIVNLNNIKSYNGKAIILDNEQEVPISRNNAAEFKEKMISFFNRMML